ncbi:MAG TPA: YidC/Oxa1 family membrane protein insertase, partial [Candidatus Paceibacterota bacterium]
YNTAMISGLFHSFIFQPLYNALVFLVGAMPGGDVGLAIIALTFFVRLVLFPLSLKASRAQLIMRTIEPERALLQEKFKNDREALARGTMALFRTHKVNPFASFLFILVQLPIIIGLYLVFYREGGAASFDPSLLYSFVAAPSTVSFSFLGLIDLTGKSLVLALAVGVLQFFYARMVTPATTGSSPAGSSFMNDLARSMNIQMRYGFPVVLGVISYFATAAVALYFVASNIFGIVQELVVKQLHKPAWRKKL